jgi:hypothetical protein
VGPQNVTERSRIRFRLFCVAEQIPALLAKSSQRNRWGLNAVVKRLREGSDDSADIPHLIETLPASETIG